MSNTTQVQIDVQLPKIPLKPKPKRSRNGCLSCKKLHIKCNEDKPICEYCIHTNRKCVYPEKVLSKLRMSKITKPSQIVPKTLEKLNNNDLFIASTSNRDIATNHNHNNHVLQIFNSSSIGSDLTLSLNSLTSQLNINNFELRLLKFFVENGGEFYSFGINNDIENFWTVEVPNMWQSSDLVRTSVFAISSMTLWHYYDLERIHEIYVDDDIIVKFDDEGGDQLTVPNKVPLFTKTNEYFQECLKLYLNTINSPIADTVDGAGMLVTCFVNLFSIICIHPFSPFPLIDYEKDPSIQPVDIIEFCKLFRSGLFPSRIDSLLNSKYGCLLYPRELKFDKYPKDDDPFAVKFPIIEHLKDYLHLTVLKGNFDSTKRKSFETAVNNLYRLLFLAYKFNYVLPIFKSIIPLSSDDDFLHFVRNKNYTAMKILYYYACLNSIADFKIFRKNSIWDTYIEEFKEVAYEKFNGQFEEIFDKVLYNSVCYFKEKKNKKFRLDMLFRLGIEDPMLFEYYNKLGDPTITGDI